jgi:hypothetical protein
MEFQSPILQKMKGQTVTLRVPGGENKYVDEFDAELTSFDSLYIYVSKKIENETIDLAIPHASLIMLGHKRTKGN